MKVDRLTQLFEDVVFTDVYLIYKKDKKIAVIRKSKDQLPQKFFSVTEKSIFNRFSISPYQLEKVLGECSSLTRTGNPDKDPSILEIVYEFSLKLPHKPIAYFSISSDLKESELESTIPHSFLYICNDPNLVPIIKLFIDQHITKKKEIQYPTTTKPKVDIE